MSGESNLPAPRKEGDGGREPGPPLKQEEGMVHQWAIESGLCVCTCMHVSVHVCMHCISPQSWTLQK